MFVPLVCCNKTVFEELRTDALTALKINRLSAWRFVLLAKYFLG
jgi:hypothetical protein